MALDKDPLALQYLSNNFKVFFFKLKTNIDVVIAGVRKNGLSLEFVYEAFK